MVLADPEQVMYEVRGGLPSEDEPIIPWPEDKGVLHRGVFEAHCACGWWESSCTYNRKEAARDMKATGWKNDRRRGWLCPTCVKKQQKPHEEKR